MSTRNDLRRVRAVEEAIQLAKQRFGAHVVEDAYPDGLCVYCGQPGESRDHIVPVSRGGLHSRENMVPACHHCNGMKRNMLPQDFFALYRKAAWHFARRAVHAKPVWIDMAKQYARIDREDARR